MLVYRLKRAYLRATITTTTAPWKSGRCIKSQPDIADGLAKRKWEPPYGQKRKNSVDDQGQLSRISCHFWWPKNRDNTRDNAQCHHPLETELTLNSLADQTGKHRSVIGLGYHSRTIIAGWLIPKSQTTSAR